MKKWKTTFCILGILVIHVESNPFEVTSAIMTSNLEQNVDTLQYSNQKTVESGIVQTDTSQLIAILRQQDAKFQALENQIQECRHKSQDYQVLAQRLTQMETRLNLTLQENVDLRATIQNSRRPKRSLERKGRNFLASTATSDFLIKKPVVAFDAYRNGPFDHEQSILRYDGTLVNAGNGMNVTTGIFTAPHPGIYAFNFHALTRDGTATYIKIMHNERNVGGAYRRHEGEGDESHIYQSEALEKAEGMLTQSVVVQVEENDQVSVFAYHGNIRDGGWHYTHFNGYLIS